MVINALKIIMSYFSDCPQRVHYHVYADDTQIYVSFKCDDPSQALGKINACISDKQAEN